MRREAGSTFSSQPATRRTRWRPAQERRPFCCCRSSPPAVPPGSGACQLADTVPAPAGPRAVPVPRQERAISLRGAPTAARLRSAFPGVGGLGPCPRASALVATSARAQGGQREQRKVPGRGQCEVPARRPWLSGRRGLWVRALASSGLQPSGTPCPAHLPVCFGAGGGGIFSQGPGCLARASYLQLKVCSGSLQDPPAKEAPGKGGRGRLRATTAKSPLLPAAPQGLGSQQGARSSLTWGKAAPEGGGWKGVPGAQPSPSCRGHATEGRPPGSPASPRADLQSSALSDETPGG